MFHLTLYDTSYLHLAKSMKLPLATRDDDLADAAKRYGVSLLKA
jgi:predicted nucleic acid-binding protein